jgi:hypothetical protein
MYRHMAPTSGLGFHLQVPGIEDRSSSIGLRRWYRAGGLVCGNICDI